MIIAISDIETTGLNIDTDRITEIACCLFDTDTYCAFEHWSTLVFEQDYPVPTEEALKVTGQTLEGLKRHGRPPAYALNRFKEYSSFADAYIFHNGLNFDWPIIKNEFRRAKREIPEKPIIDSQEQTAHHYQVHK